MASGAMYAGVPTTRVDDPPSPRTLAMPKSATRTPGSAGSSALVRMMLSGLMSRWTIPRAWAASRASRTCRATARANWAGSVPLRRTKSRSVGPGAYSMTMPSRPPSAIKSATATTWGWRSDVRAVRSVMKRLTTSGSSRYSPRRSLTATASPVLLRTPSRTTPEAPVPMGAPRR